MILSEVLKNTAVPTSFLEEWRYTAVKKILNEDYSFDEPVLEIKEDPTWFDPLFYNFIFINGFFQKDLSHSGQLNSYFSATESKNTDFNENDYFMRLSQNLGRSQINLSVKHSPKRPIRFLFITTPTAAKQCSLPRLKIDVAEHVEVNFIEEFRNSGREGLNVDLFDVKVSPSAKVRWFTLNFNKDDGEKNRRLHYLRFNVGQNAHLEHYCLCFGNQFIRSQLHVVLQEEAKVYLKSANLLTGSCHVDLQTEIIHAEPKTHSEQQYKSITAGKSKFIFRGKIHIAHAAKNSIAHQKNQNIKLSSESEIDTQPILNIDCNEVQCSHGATISALRNEDIFYMQARGISADQAKILLGRSFLIETLSGLEDLFLKNLILDMIKNHDELFN